MDVFGKALKSYAAGNEETQLILHNSYGEPEEMPVWYFFREYEDMPERERMALSIAEGRVLDLGAGTGSHSLILQQLGYEVVAIDTSADAVDIMQQSGVKEAACIDFFELKEERFDTIYSLMNGIGIIGKLSRFKAFLDQAKALLNPGGQLVFDSSNIKYLYEETNLPTDRYFGEVQFQYEFEGRKGGWFDWVYLDPDKLSELADEAGWYVYFLHSDEHDQYLVRMIPK